MNNNGTWKIVCPYCNEELEVLDMEGWVQQYEWERKELQRKAHAVFDPIWKSGIVKREEAYSWLAKELGVDYAECHFSSFSVPQLKTAIMFCELVKARMYKTFCETEWRKHIREYPLANGEWSRNDFKTTGVD